MIRSMTGFGRAQVEVAGVDLSAEVKSVNHRFLKLSTRLPDTLNGSEHTFEALARKELKRGAVNISLHLGKKGGEGRSYALNIPTIKRYYQELKELAVELALTETPSLDQVARIPGAVEISDTPMIDEEALLAAATKVLEEAVAGCVAARDAEGNALGEDLTRLTQALLALNLKAAERAPTVVAAYRERLVERISKLLDGTKVTLREEDITREVAMFADRSDINEEVQRLGHHCDSLLELIAGDSDEAGRRLDFIAQEMLREANTMGSKANDGELSQIVLEMKATVEKIKEQVQNVE